MSRLIAALLVLVAGTWLQAAAPSAHIADGKFIVPGLLSTKGVKVVGADGRAEEIAARPAVNGEWASDGGKIVFTPKYPLKPGAKYRVQGGGESLEVTAPAAAP